MEGVTCQLRTEFLDFVSEPDRYPFKIERSDYSTNYSLLLSENSEGPHWVRRRDRLLTISCNFGVNETQFCAKERKRRSQVPWISFFETDWNIGREKILCPKLRDTWSNHRIKLI